MQWIYKIVSQKLLWLIAASIFFLGSSCKPPPPEIPLPPSNPNLVEGPPRGVAMLHMMVPQAWDANIKQLTQTLIDSEWKNLAINVLCGGGFGFDMARLNHVVHELSKEGRQLHLVLYVTNGPSQRQWQTTPVEGLGTRMSPEEWRRRIQSDPEVQEQYRQQVRALSEPIASTFALNGQVYLIPALEDNLDDASFVAMHELTKQALSSEMLSKIKIGRNPCIECYSGNEDGLPSGVFLESHISRPEYLVHSNGVATNDGREWLIPGESSLFPQLISLDALVSVRDKAKESSNVWILWKAAYQGLDENAPANPYERNYRTPGLLERAAIIDHIRD